NVCFVLLGFLIPLFATSIFFISKHAFSDFTTAVFFSNVGYVGYGNKLLIPQGFLILKLLMLTSAVSFIFWKRKEIDNVSIFTIVWLSFSIFNTFFSGRPYTHYVLVTLPAFCLLVGLLIVAKKQKEKVIYLIILLSTAILIYNTFKPNFKKSIRYYPNVISFLMNKQNVVSYQSFFDQKTPRDYEIASFIKTHTKPSDNIFIWGDSAQIYALSGKLPPGKYTVAYHIEQYKSGLEQTQSALNLTQPKYIVSLPESAILPFRLSTYSTKFVFKGVVIYERDF
ncbi:MAG TPA: hypothetical protein VLG67_04490, partial [Candidatus Saccharimonadales bacterium]|nr:hypothetical protein [Candidatus Saccharimonadales bacterium]